MRLKPHDYICNLNQKCRCDLKRSGLHGKKFLGSGLHRSEMRSLSDTLFSYTTFWPFPYFSARNRATSSRLNLRSPRVPMRYAFSIPLSSQRRTVLICTLRSRASSRAVNIPLLEPLRRAMPKTPFNSSRLSYNNFNSLYLNIQSPKGTKRRGMLVLHHTGKKVL